MAICHSTQSLLLKILIQSLIRGHQTFCRIFLTCLPALSSVSCFRFSLSNIHRHTFVCLQKFSLIKHHSPKRINISISFLPYPFSPAVSGAILFMSVFSLYLFTSAYQHRPFFTSTSSAFKPRQPLSVVSKLEMTSPILLRSDLIQAMFC